MTDDLSRELSRPESATRAMQLGYTAAALALVSLIIVAFLRSGENLAFTLIIGLIFVSLRATFVFWFSRGSSPAKIAFVILWLIDLISLFRFGLSPGESGIMIFGLVISLLMTILESIAVVLLFRPDSKQWFQAHKIEKQRAASLEAVRMESMLNSSPPPRPDRQQRAARPETAASGPACDTCHRVLEKFDLAQGASVVMGQAPVLYLGVVCTACRMIQCRACKGSPSEAPCRQCGSPVKPAYQHYL